MNEEILKSYLVRDKGFLRALYEGPNPLKNRRILNGASDTQLNTVIRYLHFLANGRIAIKKVNFDKLKEHEKLKLIKSKCEKLSNCEKLIA